MLYYYADDNNDDDYDGDGDDFDDDNIIIIIFVIYIYVIRNISGHISSRTIHCFLPNFRSVSSHDTIDIL